MRLKKERIAALAQTLVHQLTEKQAIRLEASKAELISSLEQIITGELLIEDRLDAEVRQILETYRVQIEKGQADERKMFLMIKKQLAKERGIIL
ncbi:MAG TPA: DUF507 family protein [Nitrospiria bacterium]|jgi:hypothetical protein|nr:DUF507 family protein [Nitrospiria bacterium]